MALLSAALFAGVAAVYFTVVSATGATEMNRYTSAVAIWISSCVVLYFILAIRRLQVAYVNAFPAPWSVDQATRGGCCAVRRGGNRDARATRSDSCAGTIDGAAQLIGEVAFA
jgi:hypothetical protein